MNIPAKLLLAGILSSVPLLASAAEAEADRLAQIHAGMSRDEVQALAGRPDIASGADRAGRTLWTYDFTDEWGYQSEFDVTFGADGRVADTSSERHRG